MRDKFMKFQVKFENILHFNTKNSIIAAYLRKRLSTKFSKFCTNNCAN